MRHRLLSLLTALSVLLCVAVVVVWVASKWTEVSLQWRRAAPGGSHTYITYAVTAVSGRLVVSREHPFGPGAYDPHTGPRLRSRRLGRSDEEPLHPAMWRGAGGFYVTRPRDPQPSGSKYPYYYSAAAVPLWLPALALLLSPAASARRSLGRRRSRGFHCECGYDLTGNVSGVCPECGARHAHVRP